MKQNKAARIAIVAVAVSALGMISPAATGAGAPDPGPAFTLETTVMVDDGSDTCATDTHVVVDAGTMLRFCYTMTNTGTEGLNLHGVWDSRLGWVAGPLLDHVVEPGESLSVTATGSEINSMFHKVKWYAAGVDLGHEVGRVDYVYITIEGTSVQLDMTVMVDDGQDTCGTETELSVPAGTQVRLCYAMTNTLDEPVGTHFLLDEQLSTLLNLVGPELASGENLVHTEVAIIDETVTHTGYWGARANESAVHVQAIDSVTIEVVETPPSTTTSTSLAPGIDPCATTTLPDVPTTSPATTSPPTSTTTPIVLLTTTTTTTTTSTTTTMPPSFTTTTSTTSPVIVLFTTTTTLGEPAGFANAVHHGPAGSGRPVDRRAAAPCPPPPPPGGELPPTGSPASALIAIAALTMAFGGAALVTARGTRR